MTIASKLLLRQPIKWAAIGKKALRQEEYRKEDEARKQKVLRSFEYEELESFKRLNSSGRLRLDSMERAFTYLFDNGVKLGYMQERLIRQVKIAFLKNMFADDLVPNLKFLCQKFLIKQLIDSVAILFPRRVCFLRLSCTLS